MRRVCLVGREFYGILLSFVIVGGFEGADRIFLGRVGGRGYFRFRRNMNKNVKG